MSARRKILYCIASLGSGGRERQVVELLSDLSSKEYFDIELVVMCQDVFYSEIDTIGIKIHQLIRKTRKDPAIYGHLFRICRAFHPDIIHTWDSMSSFYAAPVAKAVGARFVNGMIRESPLELSPFGKLWTRARCTFPFSDAIVSNSYAGIESYKAPARKSYCIPNGFNGRRMQEIESEDAIRSRFGINSEKVVGMVASFSEKKDYRTYVAAAQRILDKRDDVQFLSVGHGPTLDEVRNSVGPQFQKKILFLGRRKEVESIVNVFDIGVLSTFTEGISNCIMEYMALGKPAIATDGGGTRELLLDGETGFLVRPRDVNDLMQKIETLLNNPDLAGAMGLAGQERIRRSFSMDKMRQSYVDLYHMLLR